MQPASFLFSPHPLVLQTAYSDLKRRALEQSSLLMGTAGSVSAREVKGRRFLYRTFYDVSGAKKAEYLGPENEAGAVAKADALRERIALSNALVAEARLLARQGYVRVDARTGAIAAALANHGLFRAGAVLVGSHAYGALLNELGARAAAFFTEDIDVARGARLELAREHSVSFEKMLADSGVPLSPVPALDRKEPSTSYKARGGSRLRVDLLAPTAGSEVGVREVPELSAHATALPYLRYLLERPLDSVLLGRESVVPVRVPRPEAFAWHKVLVSQLRGATREKKEKDAAQAAVLFALLAESEPGALRDAFEALPAKAVPLIRRGAVAVLTRFGERSHRGAQDMLRKLLAL